MTIKEIKAFVNGPEYDFLRTNDHLKDRLVFLTLGGSYAYGTNVETSDVDVRGCALNSPSDIIGLTSFDQAVDNRTDTTVYSFNRLIPLLMSCNPNTIEMLGCKPEHYIFQTEIGSEMIKNRKLFLSQVAAKAFGGYATQQLRRLENAIARDRVSQPRREEHLLHATENSLADFASKHLNLPAEAVTLFIDESPRDDLDVEIFANIHLDRYPAREFNSLLNELKNTIDNYTQTLSHRNHKKDFEHLNKHAMHLIRLYLMCLDILEKEEVVTYRENDREMLLEIRRGKYMNEDGTYQQEFFDMVEDYEKRLAYARENTGLPKFPDFKRIQEFVMDVNRGVLSL